MVLPINDRFENTDETKEKIIKFCNETLIKLNDESVNDDIIISYDNSLP